MRDLGGPTVACTICNGPLSAEGKEWVCKVGHRFTFPELADEQTEAVIRTLWYSLRALEDRAIARTHVADDYDKAGLDRQAVRLRAQRLEDLAMVDQLHELLQRVDAMDHRQDAESDVISHEELPGQGSHS